MSYPYGNIDDIERWYSEETRRIERSSHDLVHYEHQMTNLRREYGRRKHDYYMRSGVVTGPSNSASMSSIPNTVDISMMEFEELQEKRARVEKLSKEIKRMKNPIKTEIKDIDKRVLLINK